MSVHQTNDVVCQLQALYHMPQAGARFGRPAGESEVSADNTGGERFNVGGGIGCVGVGPFVAHASVLCG